MGIGEPDSKGNITNFIWFKFRLIIITKEKIRITLDFFANNSVTDISLSSNELIYIYYPKRKKVPFLSFFSHGQIKLPHEEEDGKVETHWKGELKYTIKLGGKTHVRTLAS